ncbi:stage III sporulation protein AF [Metabacillus sediminilitoris]|uniref:Stage III sporulation protein AF n=1 Tax=Metabacillus sediminilitoris TaxID=2567941 RepID=A0A4S4C4C1_9BACI|nr:stage III sporulation protein AF [Metabacillus sediminilitoris]QGQ47177.1 stage III sporulation protein AF [Metabacillus sediminilitoris]THF80521.1 stage III sporulation protein AF [Metabacillus sediminilitoris]
MSFLTEWITNIIVFILLAIVIDLLLPNSSMQKYAKMVISLLLIIVIINPIFKIFSKDMNDILAEFQLGASTKEDDVKNLIELQKNEIQASQRAYILEQMAVQMKTMAKEELVKKYDVTIDTILLSESEQVVDINSQKDLTHIQVFLQKNPTEEAESKEKVEAVEAVQPIAIDTTKEQQIDEQEVTMNVEEITAFLAKIWEVEEEKITLELEGGEESIDEQ